MKTARLVVILVAVVAVQGFVSAPQSSAQLLSNKWFSLKFSGKGSIVDPATGDASKATFALPVYAQFLSTSNNPSFYTYQVHLWTETDSGWTNAVTTSKNTTSTNNVTFFSDFNITVVGMHGDSVSCFHTSSASVKTDKTGAFKSATYQGGGEIYTGSIISGGVTNRFYGNFSISGKTVAASKLPFSAP